MPSSGSRRRASNRAPLSRLTVESASVMAPTTTSTSLDALPDPCLSYPFRAIVGHWSELDLNYGRLCRFDHPKSSSARRLFAGGLPEATAVQLVHKGVMRTYFIVTGPLDLDAKIAAFKSRLNGLIEEYHPDALDFRYVVVPELASPRRLSYVREDYWFAVDTGVIWSLDITIALRLVELYTRMYHQFYPH